MRSHKFLSETRSSTITRTRHQQIGTLPEKTTTNMADSSVCMCLNLNDLFITTGHLKMASTLDFISLVKRGMLENKVLLVFTVQILKNAVTWC